eukprot:403372246
MAQQNQGDQKYTAKDMNELTANYMEQYEGQTVLSQEQLNFINKNQAQIQSFFQYQENLRKDKDQNEMKAQKRDLDSKTSMNFGISFQCNGINGMSNNQFQQQQTQNHQDNSNHHSNQNQIHDKQLQDNHLKIPQHSKEYLQDFDLESAMNPPQPDSQDFKSQNLTRAQFVSMYGEELAKITFDVSTEGIDQQNQHRSELLHNFAKLQQSSQNLSSGDVNVQFCPQNINQANGSIQNQLKIQLPHLQNQQQNDGGLKQNINQNQKPIFKNQRKQDSKVDQPLSDQNLNKWNPLSRIAEILRSYQISGSLFCTEVLLSDNLIKDKQFESRYLDIHGDQIQNLTMDHKEVKLAYVLIVSAQEQFSSLFEISERLQSVINECQETLSGFLVQCKANVVSSKDQSSKQVIPLEIEKAKVEIDDEEMIDESQDFLSTEEMDSLTRCFDLKLDTILGEEQIQNLRAINQQMAEIYKQFGIKITNV